MLTTKHSPMSLLNKARLSLVGAGPGDPELITLKGIKALQSADVVLYDSLANEELLEYAPPRALRVPVGKRAGRHSYRQEEINLMIVQYAMQHGHVVRLKGGDPFVFGRGHEELQFVEAMGIPVTLVPGISSCISVPELQGVPLTRRGTSESFWVITGTTRSGQLSGDIALAAQSSATVVVLMGIRKIREIMGHFAAAGQSTTPVMVIRNGSLPEETQVLGTVSTISDRLEAQPSEGPGLIVIGEVVALHPATDPQLKTNHIQVA